VAAVSNAAALPEITVPRLLTLLYAVVGVAFGRPSSMTVSSRLAVAGRVID
jgi:hypothetical protein